MSGAIQPSQPDSCATGISRRKLLQIGVAATLAGSVGAPTAKASDSFVELGHSPGCALPTYNTSLKQRAKDDYQASLQQYGGRLANDIQELIRTSSRPPHEQFAVTIIGSGYGAAICAARLSASLSPGLRICILERGREWVPGTFPDTYREASRQTRQKLTGQKKGQIDNPLGLFHIKMNAEINTLSGSGLGGTSLINASVALKPDADVFSQVCWPTALRDRVTLDPYFERAARMLSLARTPHDQTCKVQSRRDAADHLNPRPGFFDLSPLTVTYDGRYLDASGRNPHGMIQRPCELCGDCITGCNVGAKNTLTTNYLPLAKLNGTEMYTQIEVQSVAAVDGHYQIQAIARDDCSGTLQEFPVTIASQMVIVAAGSPGSAEILLQSRQTGMEFSQSLGQRWSFNGDTIGFVVDPHIRAPIGGVGAYPESMQPIGPTVQTSLNYSRRAELRHRLLIQEAALPRAVTKIFSLLLQDRDLDKSMVMLGMGHDGAEGKIIWKEDRWQVDWPDLRDSRYRKMVFQDFDELAQAHGGWYKRMRAFGDTLVSVHPLGGCGMSDDPTCGVVNDRGQVFDGRTNCYQSATGGSPPIYPGLYVADGSIMSSSLGVNPLMTICAVSERIAEQIVADPQWTQLFGGRAARG